MDPPQPRLIHRRHHILHLRQRTIRRTIGGTEPAQVEPGDIPGGGQRIPLRVPHPTVRDPRVEEQHRHPTVGRQAVVGDARRGDRHISPKDS